MVDDGGGSMGVGARLNTEASETTPPEAAHVASWADDGSITPVLGIGIITRNRLPNIQRSVCEIQRLTTGPYALLIADDESQDGTVEWARQQGIPVLTGSRRGVAWNKNRALYFFMEQTNCDPILIIEDDTWPVRLGWDEVWVPAARKWGHINFDGSTYGLPDLRRLAEGPGTADQPFVSRHYTGCCTLTTRDAIEKVGYLNARFRGYGWAHIEWTNRYRKALSPDWKISEGSIPTLDHGVLLASGWPSAFNADEAKKNRETYRELLRDGEAAAFCPPWQDDQERNALQDEVAAGWRAHDPGATMHQESNLSGVTLGALYRACRDAAVAKMGVPNGPPLVMYADGSRPVQTAIAICSLVLNGYIPSSVSLVGEHRWSPQARALFSEGLPFARIVPTSQLLEIANQYGGQRLIDLAKEHDVVLQAIATFMLDLDVLDVVVQFEDHLVLDGLDDLVHAIRTHDLVYSPSIDRESDYRDAWSWVRAGNQQFATGSFNGRLFGLRRHLSPFLVAEWITRRKDPAEIPADLWLNGLIASAYADRRISHLPYSRYPGSAPPENMVAGVAALPREGDDSLLANEESALIFLVDRYFKTSAPVPITDIYREGKHSQIERSTTAQASVSSTFAAIDHARESGLSIDVSIRGDRFRAWPTPLYPNFWELINASKWEPQIFALLDKFLQPGTTYIDCGAWIGPTVLYAAAKGANVTAFECDPNANDALKANLALNPDLISRVDLHEVALSEKDGPVELFAHRFGDSMSTIVDVTKGNSDRWSRAKKMTVTGVDTSRLFIEAGWLDDPDALVKMDVEGGEYALLRILGNLIRTSRCSFYISFHPHNLVASDRPASLAATQATMDWMDVFWDHLWWVPSLDGFGKVDREHLMKTALVGERHSALLFSRRDDLDRW